MGKKKGKGDENPLQTERGNTTIETTVVTAVVGMAAREVGGIQLDVGGQQLPGDNSRTVGEFFNGLTGGNRMRGVSVEVGEREAAVDLNMKVEAGKSIPEVTGAVRDTVVRRVEDLTGLSVTEVNINIDDLFESNGQNGS